MAIHSSILGLKDGIWLWLELVLAASVCFVVFLRTGLLAKLEERIPTLDEAEPESRPSNVLLWPTAPIETEPVYAQQGVWQTKGNDRWKLIVTR